MSESGLKVKRKTNGGRRVFSRTVSLAAALMGGMALDRTAMFLPRHHDDAWAIADKPLTNAQINARIEQAQAKRERKGERRLNEQDAQIARWHYRQMDALRNAA